MIEKDDQHPHIAGSGKFEKAGTHRYRDLTDLVYRNEDADQAAIDKVKYAFHLPFGVKLEFTFGADHEAIAQGKGEKPHELNVQIVQKGSDPTGYDSE